MKEGLFRAIAMDKRVPKIRLKLSGHDHDWFGNFVAFNLKKTSPQIAKFDAWTKEDFLIMENNPPNSNAYVSAAERGIIDLVVASSNVVDIEIIGFVNPERPKRKRGQKKPRITKKLEWAHPPCLYELDTLKDWDLVAWNIIRDDRVLDLFHRM